MELLPLPEDLREIKTAPTKRWLVASALGSISVLLISIFRWPLVNILSVFLEPFLEILTFGAFIIIASGSLVHALRGSRRSNPTAWRPFGICVVVGAISLFTPFDALSLKANFSLYQARRTEVAKNVIAGNAGSINNATASCGDFVQLPKPDEKLSADGVIAVDHAEDKSFVLFFTFRGILERFSGYVYSPSGDPPTRTLFCGDGREIEQVAPNWFWYAS